MAAGAGQSRVSPFGFLLTHAAPWFGLPSHTPLHGDAGLPLQAAPPTDVAQTGHGWAGRPVRMVTEFSWKFSTAPPVDVSSVPLTGDENVFVMHTDSPALLIGSGVPNRQPASVQSTSPGVDPAVVAPTVHDEPVHESVNRFVAPDGVALSGTCSMPPPSDRLPHARFLRGVTAPRSRNVFPQYPLAAVDRKSRSSVVVDVEVDDVVVLEVDVLVVELVDVDDVLVLVVLDVDVELVEVDDVVDDDVDVELVDDVLVDVELVLLVLVVVVVWFGLQTSGSGLMNSGTAAASMQSVL